MTPKKKTTNPSGNSRASKNRKIWQDALRQELASRNYISQLRKIADRLDPEAVDAYQQQDVPMVGEIRPLGYRRSRFTFTTLPCGPLRCRVRVRRDRVGGHFGRDDPSISQR